MSERSEGELFLERYERGMATAEEIERRSVLIAKYEALKVRFVHKLRSPSRRRRVPVFVVRAPKEVQ